MRRWLAAGVVAVALATGLGLWACWNGPLLRVQWECYAIGAARSFDEAKPHLVWLDRHASCPESVAELVARWGAGNGRFDLHLARYIDSPESSETLRGAFARQLAARPELLHRWAHYWTWRAREEPDQLVASTVAFFDLLAQAQPGRTITWRDVLDLQAVWGLCGEADRVKDLDRRRWSDVYTQWKRTRADPLPHVRRPEVPLPGWQGPVAR